MLNKVEKALAISAETFNRYANYHFAKATADGAKKGAENAAIFRQITQAQTELKEHKARETLPQEDKPEGWFQKQADLAIASIEERPDFLKAQEDKPEECNHPIMWRCEHCEEDKPEPKTEKQYKLSEMWKVWYVGGLMYGDAIDYLDSHIVFGKGDAEQLAFHIELNDDGDVVAITRADATEFTEGEGLDK